MRAAQRKDPLRGRGKGGRGEEEEEVEKQLPSGKTRNRNQAAGRPAQGAGALASPFFLLPAVNTKW